MRHRSHPGGPGHLPTCLRRPSLTRRVLPPSLPPVAPRSVQISHLSVASSRVELVEAKSIDISIQNVSVAFKGTLSYGYTSAWG